MTTFALMREGPQAVLRLASPDGTNILSLFCIRALLAVVDKLRAELASADWSRRHAAYEETLRRGGNAPGPTPSKNDALLGHLSSNCTAGILPASRHRHKRAPRELRKA